MILYLIRHGKTEANARGLYCGSTDLPLSEAGREALTRLHYPLPARPKFITSGMRRCNETLALLFSPASYSVCPDLREIDFGVFEMGRYETLKDDPAYQAWLSGNNEENVPPGGESGVEMTHRVLAAFRQIEQAGENAVIVTHGGVIAAIMADLFPQENKHRYQWQPEPGGGYCLRSEGNGYVYSCLRS